MSARDGLDLDAIAARAEAATPGLWRASDDSTPEMPNDWHIRTPPDDYWIAEIEETTRSEADATFIAHARSDVPALVGVLQQVLAAVEQTHLDVADPSRRAGYDIAMEVVRAIVEGTE